MDGIKKPKKNSTLIKHHKITDEEMRKLATIIDAKEKKYRRKVEKRRMDGIRSRDEYLTDKQKQTELMVSRLRGLVAENPTATQRELAEMMNVDRSYISKLLKRLL